MRSLGRRYRRISLGAGLAGVALMMGVGSCEKVPFSEHADDDEQLQTVREVTRCGVERWAVKTGTDSDIGSVNMNPQDTTISTLVSFPRPSSLPPTRRVGTAEFQVYRLTDITMTVYKLENDSDYHLVLSDGSRTLIAEIPHPDCVGGSSPFLAGLRDARATFDRSYTATPTFQTANVTATVVGAGFFDFLHGQRGVAPNGIELHAVLSICFGQGCVGSIGDDFSLSIQPPSQSAPQGGSAGYVVSTAVTSGSPQAINLQATDLPVGVTAIFDPPDVTAGASSQLTLWIDAASPPQWSTFSVIGVGSTTTHSASADLNVTAGDNPIVNGDFETGDLTGWEWTDGFVRVTRTRPHSGSWAAQVGSQFPLAGDSVVSQVVNIPASGNHSLSFWYRPECHDVIADGWQDAEIRSVADELLLRIFHICDGSGAWQFASVDLTPFNGSPVKIVFTAHDDGGAGDPTWFHVDDVAMTTQ